MTSKRITNLKLWLLLGILAALLMGCAPQAGLSGQTQPVQSFPVDPLFKEFYSALGGQQILGQPISRVEQRDDGLQCQFVERAQMCFNPLETGLMRFHLAPLGGILDIHPDTHSVAHAAAPGARVVDGFVIYEKFLPLYDRLYGAIYVGAPLTELRINYELNRVEQFFTNVGFYKSLKDPNGPVFLIPYGAYICGSTCSNLANEYWAMIKSNLAEQPFAESIARLGGVEVFGTPLLQPELVDGYIRQVYTNVIFQAPINDLSQVSLYPLPAALGIQPDALAVKMTHDQLVFFTLDQQTGLGHNVPKPFEQFLAQHGSTIFSGNPIQEVKAVAGQNLYQQCFENLCLLYDPSASDPMKVRLAPLGTVYMQAVNHDPALEVQNKFDPANISLTVAVDRPNISSTDEQLVRMVVEEMVSGQGIPRVEGTLNLSYLDRTPVQHHFPPTDADGRSLVVIPPQFGLENGTRLQYQVCLNLPSDQPICRQDSYLIWNSR